MSSRDTDTGAWFASASQGTSQQSPRDIVTAFIEAIEASDFETARRSLSDTGFTYRSPISRTDNADTFMMIISRIGPILEGIERRRTFVDGGNVCSILNYRTTMEALPEVPVAQVASVIDGKIVALEAFFDASEYNKMLADWNTIVTTPGSVRLIDSLPGQTWQVSP